MTVVRDVNSTCDVLWVSRSTAYDLSALFGSTGTRPVTTAAKIFAAQGGQWLRSSRGSNVLTCSFDKDIDGPVGVFQMSLKPTPNMQYDQFMRAGDLVFIYMSGNAAFGQNNPEDSSRLVTIGIIDRVSKSDDVDARGAETSMVTVNGRDLGVIFQETSTVFDPSFAVVEQTLFNSDYIELTAEKQLAVSPLETVLNLIELIYTGAAGTSTVSKLAAAQWRLQLNNSDIGNSISLASLIDLTSFVQTPMFGYDVPSSIGLAQAGNVWALLDAYSNRVINEMFIDVRDFTQAELDVIGLLQAQSLAILDPSDVQHQFDTKGRLVDDALFQAVAASGKPDGEPVMALVLRQRPYDADSFAKLPENFVEETEVGHDETSRTYHDTYNFFRVRFPSLPEEFQEFVYGIRVRVDSVFKYGLRRLEAQSRYCFTSSRLATGWDPSKKQDFSQVFEYYVGLLSTWYAANEEMLTGEIQLKHLRPDIRVGTRLRRTKGGKLYDYYITGVHHQFSVEAGSSNTSLIVHRGVEVGGDGLVNNLIWRNGASQIPPSLNTFGRFHEPINPNDPPFVAESELADRVIRNLLGE